MANDKAGQVTREAPNARQCQHCADYFDESTIPGAVHLASCKVYNGHKNYETWNVSLWLDNEEGSHKYWRRMARTCAERVKDGEGNRYVDDPVRKCVMLLADAMKDEIDDTGDAEGMHADLLGAAFSEVDWEGVAEGFCEGITAEDCTPDADEDDGDGGGEYDDADSEGG